MKYIKKYKLVSESLSLRDLDDDELREKLKWLNIDKNEIEDQINQIKSIIRERVDKRDESYIGNLPENIFDFNKDQLDFIFVNKNGLSQDRYNTSQRYFRNQLFGVFTSGYNIETNQFKFYVTLQPFLDEYVLISRHLEEDFKDNPNDNDKFIKTIKLLGNNLDRGTSNSIRFDVLNCFDDNGRNYIEYRSENDIDLFIDGLKITNINSVGDQRIIDIMKRIVLNDLDYKD